MPIVIPIAVGFANEFDFNNQAEQLVWEHCAKQVSSFELQINRTCVILEYSSIMYYGLTIETFYNVSVNVAMSLRQKHACWEDDDVDGGSLSWHSQLWSMLSARSEELCRRFFVVDIL